MSGREIDEKRLEEIAHKARILRDKYNDKIPDHIITGTLRYKVQKNWFNAISLFLMRAAHRKELDESVMEEYRRFDKILKQLQEGNATKEEIEAGNRILTLVIKYCEMKLEEHRKAA